MPDGRGRAHPTRVDALADATSASASATNDARGSMTALDANDAFPRGESRIDALASRVKTHAIETDVMASLTTAEVSTATVETPYSRRGPHPSEWKRRRSDGASVSVERMSKRAIVLVPSVEDDANLDRIRLKGWREGEHAGALRRAAMQAKETRARTEEVCAELREKGWELRKVEYMSGDELGFVRLANQIGAVIVAVPPALQSAQLLEMCRRVRAEGVLVFQCARVGHYLAHNKHLDLQETNALPSKRMTPHAIGLLNRCETRDDGFRQVTMYVVSMPGTMAERNAFREHVFPRLMHRCRKRRIRLSLVDLKDDSPNAGPGQALNALGHAMRTGGIFIVLLSAKHEIDWYSSVRLHKYSQDMRMEAQTQAVETMTWLRAAPNDYSRVELQVGHLLRVYDPLEEPSQEEVMKSLQHLTVGERNAIRTASEREEALRSQHILAYFPSKLFYERLRAQKDAEYVDYLTSTDPAHRERIGSLLSTLYAHTDVCVSQYSARFTPPMNFADENNLFNVKPIPQTSGLDEFQSTLLQDVWTRLDLEFPAEPLRDAIAQKTAIEPELSIGERLPFYYHRASQEKALIKAIKTGRPSVSVVQGLSGAGTTSMLQHLARFSRSLFTTGSESIKISDKVVVFSDFGATEGRMHPTPTQILRNIVQQIKDQLGFEDRIPASLENVRALLLDMFYRATRARGRVIIFIDALHMVDNESASAWLPHESTIPIGVQFFLGIRRVDLPPAFEKDTGEQHRHRRMATLDYNLITQYRHRMAKLQHIALASAAPLGLKNSIILGNLKYDDRKHYARTYLQPLGIHVSNTMMMQVMDKSCAANVRGMYLTCTRIAMEDTYDTKFSELLAAFPERERDHYHQLLDGVEKFATQNLLSCVLPAIVCACNCLTREDIAHLIMSEVRRTARINDLLIHTVPRLLWSMRYLLRGDATSGVYSAPNGKIQVDSEVACDVIMERYAPKEQDKRRVYQMLAQYYGAKASGSRLLESLATIEAQRLIGNDPYKVDSDGIIDSDALHKEHERTMNILKHLPYYYTQARMFDQLVDLLTDLEFLQAKLEIGEGQSLVDDFNRILPFTCGPERPMWISHHAALSEEVIDVPGAPSGIDGRLRQQAIFNSHCMGFHIEAFQFYATHSDKLHITEDLIALREALWRNLETLHVTPKFLRQQFFNEVGDAATRRLSGAGIVDVSESAIREYCGLGRMMLCWGNRPCEALTCVSMKSGYEREGDVRCVCMLDDSSFMVGYASGAVEVWDANRGSSVARFIGHKRAVTALALINNDSIRNARTSVFVASGSKDKSIRIWRLDDSLGRDCNVLIGHAEPIASLAVAISANELFSIAGAELRCWSCSPGYPLRYVVNTESTTPITSISLAPDVSYLITANTTGIMRLWFFTLEAGTLGGKNGTDHFQVANLLPKGENAYSGMATARSSLGSHTAASRGNKKLGTKPPAVALELRGHLGEVTCTACSSNGLFASGGVDTSIMMWEPRNAKHIGLINAHDGPVTAITFTRDGKLLISASLDRTCTIHSSLTGNLVTSMAHTCRVRTADISPDSSCVITGGADGNLRLWSWCGRKGTASAGALPRDSGILRRAPQKQAEDERLEYGDSSSAVHYDRVTAACHFDLQGIGSYFITAAHDGSVRVMDSKDWKLKTDVKPLEFEAVEKTRAFSSSSITTMHSERSDSMVYFGRSDGSLTAWDFSAQSWGWSRSNYVAAHDLGVYSMTDVGAGTLVTGGGDGTVCLWDVSGREPTLMKKLVAHNARVSGLCADANSSRLYSSGGDTIVKAWDLNQETSVHEFIASDASIIACAHTPRGLATVDADGFIKLWDERSRMAIARFHLPPGVPLACRIIDDQPNWLVTTCDHAVYVHDVRTFSPVVSFPCPRAATRLPREAAVTAAAFNPEGTRAVVADAHGYVYGLTTKLLSVKELGL